MKTKTILVYLKRILVVLRTIHLFNIAMEMFFSVVYSCSFHR